ncbi:MAG: PepSY domain-containing protein [Oceanococcus sp.]
MNTATAAQSAIATQSRRRNWYARVDQWRREPFDFSRSKTTTAAKVRSWHQRAGLFACLFMAWLGASGFVLNQSADWGLDAWRIDKAWLMSMYGLHPEPPKSGYLCAGHWLAQTSEKTLLDGKPLEETVPSPIGLALGGSVQEPLLFVAANDRLVILDENGNRIDELRGYTLPISAIRRIGSSQGAVAIQDLDTFVTQDGLSWQPLSAGSEVVWSKPERLSSELQQLALPYSRPTMPMEQILIDAHSGRLFGRYGPWLVNLVGFAAVFLGLSGAWMYWNTARRRRKRTR